MRRRVGQRGAGVLLAVRPWRLKAKLGACVIIAALRLLHAQIVTLVRDGAYCLVQLRVCIFWLAVLCQD